LLAFPKGASFAESELYLIQTVRGSIVLARIIFGNEAMLSITYLRHRFSKCSVRSSRAPREKPRGSASPRSFFVFILRNLLWGSV